MARFGKDHRRPHEIALDLFKPGKTVTPKEINDFVNRGPYAAKIVWFLRKWGHDITVNKTGRSVDSYTYNGGPTLDEMNAKMNEGKPVKTPKPKIEKAKKPKVVKAKKPKVVKAKTTSEKKVSMPNERGPFEENAKKFMKHREKQEDAPVMDAIFKSSGDEVEDTFGSSGSIGGFSVDPDWDSADEVNVKNLF